MLTIGLGGDFAIQYRHYEPQTANTNVDAGFLGIHFLL